MNKRTAHLVLFIFDILAILAVYFFIVDWNDIHNQIKTGADRISYQNFFSLISLSVLVPIVHLLSYFSWKKQGQTFGNRLIVGLFLGLLVAAFYLNQKIESDLVANNYRDCINLSEWMTFSEFKTYMKIELQCVELTKD